MVLVVLVKQAAGLKAVSPFGQGVQAVKPVVGATKLFFQSHTGHPSEDTKMAAEEAEPTAQGKQFESSGWPIKEVSLFM